MKTENDPLHALLTDDASSIDRDRLATFLKPFVVFDRQTKAINFLPKFQELSNKSKIRVLLMASKARSLILDVEDGLSPNEVIGLGVMAPGSVKSSLKSLYDNRQISKNNGKYVLPQYHISEVIESINKEG